MTNGLTYLDFHLHQIVLGRALWVLHDLIQEHRFDLQVVELAYVPTAQNRLLKKGFSINDWDTKIINESYTSMPLSFRAQHVTSMIISIMTHLLAGLLKDNLPQDL